MEWNGIEYNVEVRVLGSGAGAGRGCSEGEGEGLRQTWRDVSWVRVRFRVRVRVRVRVTWREARPARCEATATLRVSHAAWVSVVVVRGGLSGVGVVRAGRLTDRLLLPARPAGAARRARARRRRGRCTRRRAASRRGPPASPARRPASAPRLLSLLSSDQILMWCHTTVIHCHRECTIVHCTWLIGTPPSASARSRSRRRTLACRKRT